MRLVYLSPVSWESFAQRPHKFVNWFHDRTRDAVIWIDPYPTRFPRISDLNRLRMPVPSLSDKHPSWLTVLKPGGLPLEPIPGSVWMNERLWRNVIDSVSHFSGSAETLLVIGKPSVLALILLERLHHCPSLYDAMDDFSAFYGGLSRWSLAHRERQIVQQVKAMWVSSSTLRDRWRRIRSDVRLVHNGLDLSALPALQARSESEKKVLGYVGTMAAWFDWDWMCALAEARPNDEIRLIGPVFNPSVRRLPENVKLLPACRHSAALMEMMKFDVGLIPFKRNKLTDSVDPIKYYEYCALALPVVSTDFGEMRGRSGMPGIFVSRSANDVAVSIKAALGFQHESGFARMFSQENSWETRFDATGLLGYF
jgi:hypothetical protein